MKRGTIAIAAMFGIIWLASYIYRRCQAGVSHKVEKKRARARRRLVERSLRTKIFGSTDHPTDERNGADGPIGRVFLPRLSPPKLKRKKKIVNSEQATRIPPTSPKKEKRTLSTQGIDRDDHMTCHICLSEYEFGQEVCCSQDDRCNHLFHKHCLLQWLLKHDDCPCCRRNLINAENETAANDLTEDDRAVNLGNGVANDSSPDLEAR